MPERRMTVLLVVFAGAILAIEGRLYYLQVVKGEQYAANAERQRLALAPVEVARGRVVSSDGVVLAEDRLAFDVAVVMSRLDPGSERKIRGPLRQLLAAGSVGKLRRVEEVRWTIEPRAEADGRFGQVARFAAKIEVESADELGRPMIVIVNRSLELPVPGRVVDSAERLGRVTGLPAAELLNRVVAVAVEVAKLETPADAAVTVIGGVGYDVVAAVETEPELFRGFEIRTRGERVRPSGPLAPHAVGYLSKFDERDVEAAMEKYQGWPGRAYFMNLQAGRTGIEKTADRILRGEPGVQCVERDYLNRVQRTLAEEPPTTGRDVVLTIDSRLQTIVESAMGDLTGAAVFVDVRTGHILAIASGPRYDPARLREEFGTLASNPERPLLDRAVAGTFPLGSVFKIVTALAALEANRVPASVECVGFLREERTFHCHRPYGHGTLELTDALRYSCNVFFYRTAQQAGGEAVIEMARRLGFGRKTGVEIPFERAGAVPERATGGELLNLAIGQGRLDVTPVQVVQMVAAVANGVELMPLRIVRELRPSDSDVPAAERFPDDRRPVRLGLSVRALDAVHAGLYKVVNERGGTAQKAFEGFNRPFKLCGKTSTAQRNVVERGRLVRDNVGWFVGYAPHENPRVAFVVMIEHLAGTEAGGSTACPVARKILESMPADLLGLEALGPEKVR